VSPTYALPHPAYVPPVTHQSSGRCVCATGSDNLVINFASHKLVGTDQDVWRQTELR